MLAVCDGPRSYVLPCLCMLFIGVRVTSCGSEDISGRVREYTDLICDFARGLLCVRPWFDPLVAGNFCDAVRACSRYEARGMRLGIALGSSRSCIELANEKKIHFGGGYDWLHGVGYHAFHLAIAFIHVVEHIWRFWCG